MCHLVNILLKGAGGVGADAAEAVDEYNLVLILPPSELGSCAVFEIFRNVLVAHTDRTYSG